MQRGSSVISPQNKAAIVSAKCQQLIDAAARGDEVQVVTLVSDPQVDPNFVGVVEVKYKGMRPHTALSIAMENSQARVAHYLADLPGIQVVNSKGYEGLPWLTCILQFLYRMGDTPLSKDLVLFKKVLRAMPELAVPTMTATYHVFDELVQQLQSGSGDKTRLAQQASLFFHEAVIRCDRYVIDDVLAKHSNVIFTVDSFLDYIKDRDLDSEQYIKLEGCLEYLVPKKLLRPADCEELKAELKKRVPFKVEISLFPTVLREELRKPARFLPDLYADFQRLVLPRMPAFEHPVGLRTFLGMEQSALFTLLYACHDNVKNENPAVLLLAQILLHHHKTPLADGTPLLNEDQQKTCLMVLINWCSLSAGEKLQYYTHRTVMEEIQSLRQETQTLRQEVAALTKLMTDMMALMPKAQREEVKAAPAPQGPGLFGTGM